MSSKRDRLEIINDMLSIIRDKGDRIKPTQIMYKANLSHQMLNDYMAELITKEFIIEKKDKAGKRTYTLTDKGYNFLKDYQMIRNFMQSYGLSE
jgi:predicted transcriptional regulator